VCPNTGASTGQKTPCRKRTISPEAGRALEKLGHAIDYLTDELVHESGTVSEDNGKIQAIRMLMARNRQIYFACPVALSLGERLILMTSRLISFRA
jgi:hypothetical protein